MANRKTTIVDLSSLSETERESVEMLREIAIQLGFAISTSIELAHKPGSIDQKKKLRGAWIKLSDMVVKFALEE